MLSPKSRIHLLALIIFISGQPLAAEGKEEDATEAQQLASAFVDRNARYHNSFFKLDYSPYSLLAAECVSRWHWMREPS